MYWVWYFCPAISPDWLPAGSTPSLETAIRQAQIVKPNSPKGRALVQNEWGDTVYSL
jgi:hypothetical protein